MANKQLNERFLKLMDLLKDKGYEYKKLSESIGIKESKRQNMIRNTASAEQWMIDKLFEVYPELHNLENEKNRPKTLREEVEEIKVRLQLMEKQIKGIKEINAKKDSNSDLISSLEKIIKMVNENRHDPLILPVIQKALKKIEDEM